jgi:hypothetical protein
LKSDVMALNGKRGGETIRATPRRFKRTRRPVVDMFFSPMQPTLKAPPIFPKVMKNPCETALLIRSKRPSIRCGEIGNPVDVLRHKFPLAISACRMSKKGVLVRQETSPSRTEFA